MKIVMVASESRPYSKTGGLADVVYSLSKELVKIGQKVSIILPLYDNIYKQFDISEFDLVATFRTHMSRPSRRLMSIVWFLKVFTTTLFKADNTLKEAISTEI